MKSEEASAILEMSDFFLRDTLGVQYYTCLYSEETIYPGIEDHLTVELNP